MITQESQITISQPRDTIRVTMDDGLVLEGPVGTDIEAFLSAAAQAAPERYPHPVMGGVLDGRLRELSYRIVGDAALAPVSLASSDGGRIYRRSLVLLLAIAIDELWPGRKVAVSYAVPDGGFYCKMLDSSPLTKEDMAALYLHMRAIVQDNVPIAKRIVPLEQAVALFEARGDTDKVRLLEQRTRGDLTIYTLRGRDDYYYGYMVPTTGSLQYFRLLAAPPGFILQYPRQENPTHLSDMLPYDKLTHVFREADDWLRRMNVEDVGRFNRVVRENRVHELILVAEALHEQRVAFIAREICDKHKRQNTRLVLIAGPSSSGKTTFSKRLAIQLLAHGLRPFTIELDNYFIDRDLTPKDENGDYDFESLRAVNLELFNQNLLELVSGRPTTLPRFNFISGKSETGSSVQLEHNQIIIVEGIHGLNPALVADIPPEIVHRVYVSALTQLNIDAHNRVPTTDVRLLRRIVRDARLRGYTVTDTLLRWQSVRRGEKQNIFPFQENADSMFNSALVYELAALRPLVEPLLLQTRPNTPTYIEANRLLSFLNWVQPFTPEQHAMIPDTSLLREFIGGSTLADYHP